jgi:uracil-DNA glycosylase
MTRLIVGEAGECPWFDGKSSERLWRWFGFTSHDELASFATLMNVYEKKHERFINLPHIQELSDAMRKADVVFLVGKVAQSIVDCSELYIFRPLWRHDKYVGLPHPSGLNRQLNTLSDQDIRRHILGVLSHIIIKKREVKDD